jgi:tryptophan synthase beta chain
MSGSAGFAPALGAFGAFGGRFVSELLMPALDELAAAHREIMPSESFQRALLEELRAWAGRPTPLTEVPRFSAQAGVRVLLKREDLLHGGAHKTNNVIGQALLARAMGKRRLIAETGAGQHGVATAMAGARLGLETVVYMGERDADRQRVNVERMKLCGARLVTVAAGSATLKDAINEALRDWAQNAADTHYLLGTVCGPDPFPSLVRDLQAVIGREARAQCEGALGGPPDAVVACVGGGSNALGIFAGFRDGSAALIGVEPAGAGLQSAHHGATLGRGTIGLLHGARTYVLQDPDGQIRESHSIAAGLDYPGVGPEHSYLKDTGRATYVAITDREALAAFQRLARTEGIISALETAHAVAHVLDLAPTLPREATIIINHSGRGDKDVEQAARLLAEESVVGSR